MKIIWVPWPLLLEGMSTQACPWTLTWLWEHRAARHWQAIGVLPKNIFQITRLIYCLVLNGNHALMVADLLSCLHDVALFVLFEWFKIPVPLIFRIRTWVTYVFHNIKVFVKYMSVYNLYPMCWNNEGKNSMLKERWRKKHMKRHKLIRIVVKGKYVSIITWHPFF